MLLYDLGGLLALVVSRVLVYLSWRA